MRVSGAQVHGKEVRLVLSKMAIEYAGISPNYRMV